MLETRKLCKIYRPKKGVPVRAGDIVRAGDAEADL